MNDHWPDDDPFHSTSPLGTDHLDGQDPAPHDPSGQPDHLAPALSEDPPTHDDATHDDATHDDATHDDATHDDRPAYHAAGGAAARPGAAGPHDQPQPPDRGGVAPGHEDADSSALEHEPADAPLEEDIPAYQPDHIDALPQHVDTSPFPPHLDIDVTPADGRDWVDPDLLGEPEPAYAPPLDHAGALDTLRAAEGADPAQSDDPAIRALALFWSR